MSTSLLQSHFFDAKGTIPVIQAVKIAYERIPNGAKFFGSRIAEDARILTGRRQLYTDSAIRKLRLLREKKQADFICLDQIESKYMKIS